MQEPKEKEEMIGYTPVELAKNLADVLKFELHYEKKRGWKFPNKLCDSIPSRDDAIFKRKREAIKGNLSKPLENQKLENKYRRLFCFVHGEFVLPSSSDIEHTYPYSKLRDNQKRLLDYLNDKENEEFKKAFLTQEGISLYFREDHDGIVKGSDFFYYLCYSEMDNLFLLCHSCNLHKSNIDPELWFQREEGYFGEPFLEEMNSYGGLHEGVLFDRVHVVKQSDPRLKFKDGTSVALPSGDNIGLGKFISNWFFTRFKTVFEENKAFYNENYIKIKESFEIIKNFIQSGQRVKALKAHLRLMGDLKMLSIFQREIVGFGLKHTSSGSETSGDDAEGRQNDILYIENTSGTIKADLYAIIKIRDCIKNWYGDKELAKGIRKFCQQLRKDDPTLLSQWETIFCGFQLFLEKYFEDKSSNPSKDELEEKIKELCQSYSTKAARIAAEEKARTEEAARIEAEKEIQRLRMLLQQMGVQESSQQSMPTSKFFNPVSSGADVTMEDVSQKKEKSSDKMNIENVDEKKQKKVDW